jgi:leucyl aminopeptidase
MSITFRMAREVPDPVTAVAIAVPSDRVGDKALAVDWDYLERIGFEGKLGQHATLRVGSGPIVLVFGVGATADLTPVVVRRAMGTVGRVARGYRSLAVVLLEVLPASTDAAAAAQALVEGVTLGAYRFAAYKSAPGKDELATVALLGASTAATRAALERGQAVAEAVCLARDLVNEPGGALTAAAFATRARSVARRAGVTIEVLDEKRIRAEKMGGLLAVNRGSVEPPRYLRLAYRPAGAKRVVALVGKGITFDSGGLSLKTAEGMKTMKDDMGGAAAVLGAMSALRAVGVEHEVRAYVPLTDNMPGGDAQRVGDVFTARNGTTVEVLNTDAEGRLVLADALSDASARQPDAIVDLATLTGACMVALGMKVAGVMGNSEPWITEVLSAAMRAGERAWWLPLPREYRRDIDSEIADLKNIGSAHGGALTAGLFLQEFVAGVPWVHVDIAGPAWSEEVEHEVGKGGTGYGVRLLLELLTVAEVPARARPAANKAPATRKAPAKRKAPARKKAPAAKKPSAVKKAPSKKKAPAKRKA